MTNKINLIIEKIQASQKVGLVTHIDGDGDAFGSLLAMKITLTSLGKDVTIFSGEDLPDEFLPLLGNNEYKYCSEYEPVDLLVTLDFNNVKRASVPEVVERALMTKTPIVTIDHHRPLDLRDLAIIHWGDEEASSTCEMIFELFSTMGFVIPKEAASFLLFGIETDTNSMQNPNTTGKAYQTVSELVKMGARIHPIVQNALKRKSVISAKLLGIVMQRLHLRKDFNLVATYVTQKDVEKLALTEDVNSGIANFLDQVREAGNILVFAETDPGVIKASMRSNRSNANVAVLAEFFGGGGHVKAAGFSFPGEITKYLE